MNVNITGIYDNTVIVDNNLSPEEELLGPYRTGNE